MCIACCCMVTIDVLTIVHPGNVIRWVWSWIKCVSSAVAGTCKYDWWYDDACAVMVICSSCINLLFTHMAEENGPTGWILCLVMLCVHVYAWYEFCCFVYFSSISINHAALPAARMDNFMVCINLRMCEEGWNVVQTTKRRLMPQWTITSDDLGSCYSRSHCDGSLLKSFSLFICEFIYFPQCL